MLASSHHLVRVFGPIVFAKSLLMVAGEPEVVEGSAVGAQLIGDHHLRREGLLSQQLAHEFDGRALVPPALNQCVEDLAFVVDSAPQILWGGRRKQAASLSGYHTDGAPPW